MNEISGISEVSNMLCSMTVTGKHDWNQILPAAGQNLRTVGMCIAPISVRRQGSFIDFKDNTVFTGSLYNCVFTTGFFITFRKAVVFSSLVLGRKF